MCHTNFELRIVVCNSAKETGSKSVRVALSLDFVQYEFMDANHSRSIEVKKLCLLSSSPALKGAEHLIKVFRIDIERKRNKIPPVKIAQKLEKDG